MPEIDLGLSERSELSQQTIDSVDIVEVAKQVDSVVVVVEGPVTPGSQLPYTVAFEPQDKPYEDLWEDIEERKSDYDAWAETATFFLDKGYYLNYGTGVNEQFRAWKSTDFENGVEEAKVLELKFVDRNYDVELHVDPDDIPVEVIAALEKRYDPQSVEDWF